MGSGKHRHSRLEGESGSISSKNSKEKTKRVTLPKNKVANKKGKKADPAGNIRE